jgi:methanogenic corrinoid protein MtbC1
MSSNQLVEGLFDALIAGDRPLARAVIHSQAAAGMDPQSILTQVLWPTYLMLDKLHRKDQLSRLSYQLATRLLRVLVDQIAANLPLTGTGPGEGRVIFTCCGPTDPDELAAQIAVDLLEAHGFTVHFAGGGIPHDELLSVLSEERPAVLLCFASAPSDLPYLRATFNALHEIGICPEMQIAVGGGVFNRAEGLAEEMGADLWVEDPLELVEVLIHDRDLRSAAGFRTVGKRRKRKSAA